MPIDAIRFDSCTTRIATKNTMSRVSHSIEEIALVSAHEATIVALFQDARHFEPRSSAYHTLAGRGATVVTAYVGNPPPIPSVAHVSLDADEPLASEWALAVLTPTFGAFAVGQDLHRADDRPDCCEGARVFDAAWGFDRLGTAKVLSRLSGALGDRIQPVVAGRLAAALLHANKAPVTPAERAFGRASLALTDALDRTASRLADARAQLASQCVVNQVVSRDDVIPAIARCASEHEVVARSTV